MESNIIDEILESNDVLMFTGEMEEDNFFNNKNKKKKPTKVRVKMPNANILEPKKTSLITPKQSNIPTSSENAEWMRNLASGKGNVNADVNYNPPPEKENILKRYLRLRRLSRMSQKPESTEGTTNKLSNSSESEGKNKPVNSIINGVEDKYLYIGGGVLLVIILIVVFVLLKKK